MESTGEQFSDVASLIRAERPEHPIYCIYPHVYRETAKEFLEGFPGRVLYAVKANPDPTVLRLLIDSGVRHFDCASLPEIELVDTIDPDSTKYFMTPVRIRGAAATAQKKHGVRHFVVDHLSALSQLLPEIEPSRSVIFARMAVHHESAMEDLSARFGAPPEDMPVLLQATRDGGAEPALGWRRPPPDQEVGRRPQPGFAGQRQGQQPGLIVAPAEQTGPMQRHRHDDASLGQQARSGARHPATEGGRRPGTGASTDRARWKQ